MATQSPDQIKALITQIANEMGVNPDLAIAIAQHESGLNPQAVGDNGSSFGLYQLHQGGELGSMSEQQAFDPATNIRRALTEVAAVAKAHPDWSPGQIAAGAQRPADQAAYTVAINSAMGSGGQTVGSGSASSIAATMASGAVAPFDPSANYETGPALQQWIMQNAGQDAWMLTNPELSKILGYVAQNNITDPNEIQSLAAQTNWYKTHSSAQQAWIQLYGSNPAQAARQVQQAATSITDQAGKMGVALTQDQLNNLSINSNFYGWTPDELTKAIAGYLPTNQNPSQGQAGTDFQAIKALATQTWGVPTTDEQIQQWTQQILAGQNDIAGVTATLKERAQSLYPTLSNQFQRGETFQTATDPYKAIAQQYLAIPAASINMTDPKWMAAISQVDPKTGDHMQMGLDQWTNYIRSNPQYGFQNTDMARNQAANMAGDLAKQLGVIV